MTTLDKSINLIEKAASNMSNVDVLAHRASWKAALHNGALTSLHPMHPASDAGLAAQQAAAPQERQGPPAPSFRG